jgi:hypothetical protein
MGAVTSSDTSVSLQETTWRHVTEDRSLHLLTSTSRSLVSRQIATIDAASVTAYCSAAIHRVIMPPPPLASCGDPVPVAQCCAFQSKQVHNHLAMSDETATQQDSTHYPLISCARSLYRWFHCLERVNGSADNRRLFQSLGCKGFRRGDTVVSASVAERFENTRTGNLSSAVLRMRSKCLTDADPSVFKITLHRITLCSTVPLLNHIRVAAREGKYGRSRGSCVQSHLITSAWLRVRGSVGGVV